MTPPEPKGKPTAPSKAVAKWFAQWWSTRTEPPHVPFRLLLAATEAVFDDLEKRECDPCMLKAKRNGSVVYLRRVPPRQYSVSVNHERLGKKLNLEQALLLIRNHVGVDEDLDDDPDDAA